MLVVATSSIFAWLVTAERIPTQISNLILSFTDNTHVIMMLIVLTYLLFGMIMDVTPAMILLVPIFYPMMINLGISPIHFGIITVVSFAVGMFSPPVGITLYIAGSLTDLKINQMTKAILPFFAAVIIVLLIVILVPQISTFLPNALGF